MTDSASQKRTGQNRPLALYVHWPFCQTKCPYCDFNSHVRDNIDEAQWRQALLQELSTQAAAHHGRPLQSIFFGGGTPSRMAPATVAAIIDKAASLFQTTPTLEITLEANPTSVEADKFAGFRLAGVNRLSLGIQSLRDDALKFLGRPHDAAMARGAIALAAQHFQRFSFDLIYGRPNHTPSQWQAELTEALALAGEHLSLYQLTIEPGTNFYTLHQRGELQLPPEDAQAELYEITQSTLAAKGMPAYEISNHAKTGAECRHNLVYWRYQDYLGIGPGAHGRITENGVRYATRTHRAPEIWRDKVMAQGHALEDFTPISAATAAREALLMNLRLTEGLCRASWLTEHGSDVLHSVNTDALARLQEWGDIALTTTHLSATAQGRQRLNSVLKMLVA